MKNSSDAQNCTSLPPHTDCASDTLNRISTGFGRFFDGPMLSRCGRGLALASAPMLESAGSDATVTSIPISTVDQTSSSVEGFSGYSLRDRFARETG